MVELTEKNQHLLYEGATLILIRKELVQFKLAIENKEKFVIPPVQNIEEEEVKDQNTLNTVKNVPMHQFD